MRCRGRPEDDHGKIGAAGRVSFGKPDLLAELLGLAPGAVTLFGLINDAGRRVSVFLDQALAQSEIINAHPLTNEAATSIRRADMIRFLSATGHDPVVLKLSA
jgi:Ala-tRNA(Pro) deacylase